MKILIIDNNIDRDSWGAAELRARAAEAAPGSVIHARRAPAEDLPPRARDWDAIVVSGSKTPALERAPWIARLDAFVGQALEAGTPLLGVCYGHQTLARVLGGYERLRPAESAEFGWTEIESLAPDALFEGLPPRFVTYSWHRDEVAALPTGTRLLARSARCGVQAFRVEGKPAFGVQFHPERGAEAGERSLRGLAGPDRRYALGAGRGAKLHRPEVGRLIFSNFLNKIAKTHE